MYKVMIIAGEWLVRAYIGAQLREDGFDINSASTVVEAIRQVREWKTEPDMVVLDSRGQIFEKELFSILNNLCPNSPLILIHGAWDSPEILDWKPKVYRLARPIAVGQIVEKVKELVVYTGSAR
jgi:DNA-binding NtrC family response regulator